MDSKPIKNVNIKDTTDGMNLETDESRKFDSDLFKRDFQKLIQKKFPQYLIKFDLVDDKNWIIYPNVTGDITDEEKNEIIKTMESEPLDDLFLNDKYYSDSCKGYNKYGMKVHENEIECILKGTYDLSNYKYRKLSSVELNFLKNIEGNKNLINGITGDWTYDYNLNYSDVLEQLVGQDLVIIEELSLYEKMNYLLRASDLVEILKNKSLSVSGSKSALIKRIIKYISKDELSTYDKVRCVKYILTKKGEKLTEKNNPSISRDIELEDKCYALILDGSINDAYKLVAAFQAQRHGPSCPRMDGEVPGRLNFKTNYKMEWNKRAKAGLSDKELSLYRKLLNTQLNLQEDIETKQRNITACIAVGVMFSVAPHRITLLIDRLCNVKIEKEKILEFVKFEYGTVYLKEIF